MAKCNQLTSLRFEGLMENKRQSMAAIVLVWSLEIGLKFLTYKQDQFITTTTTTTIFTLYSPTQ